MTTETFTESAQPVPTGPPDPSGPAEAIGWVIEVDYKDVGTLRGVVRDASWARLSVQWDGECGRKCCLDEVKFEDVERSGRFIGWVACACDSGLPEVLCLCEEPDEDETGPEAK